VEFFATRLTPNNFGCGCYPPRYPVLTNTQYKSGRADKHPVAHPNQYGTLRRGLGSHSLLITETRQTVRKSQMPKKGSMTKTLMALPLNTWMFAKILGCLVDSRVNDKMRNAIRFIEHYFFGAALEVAPGSLEFLFKSERAESSTSNRSFLRIK